MTSLILDIETLDTAPTSVITEIGALAFHRADFTEASCFFARPCLFSQLASGRTTSASTIGFHQQQGTLPTDLSASLTPQDAAHSLRRFIASVAPRRIWIQGPDFDRPIIEDFFAQFGGGLPWDFWRTRDTRTIWDAAFPDVKHDKRPHHALPDCRATLADLTKALVTLNRTEAA